MLLDRGPGIRSLTLERFHVQLSIFNGGGWIVVELEFRPSHLPPRHVRLLMGVPAQASKVSLAEIGLLKTMNTKQPNQAA